jgi:hypothetical protein
MEWFVVAVAVGMAGLAAVGLAARWRTASWGVALGVVAWVLAGAAAAMSWSLIYEDDRLQWMRAAQHRHACYALALAVEAAVAGGALALAGWKEARARAAVASWLACGFAGLMFALLR